MAILPHHINATTMHLMGNAGLGRYIFLTGSDARAQQISEQFNDLEILYHPRHHNLYLGTLKKGQKKIDVATISTGMGGPSTDIIVNELILLGGRRFLRIGTAGSLQPRQVKVGDIVIATGAVRDDKASWDYVPREYPALASFDYLKAAEYARDVLPKTIKLHSGIVHSKSSLFAREYHFSCLPDNEDYMHCLQKAGVLASEMECAQLFILSSLMNAKLIKKALFPTISCGAILAIIGDKTAFSSQEKRINTVIEQCIMYGLAIVHELFKLDEAQRTNKKARE